MTMTKQMQVGWSTRHAYTEVNISRYAPYGSGVYLIYKLQSGTWKVDYVGQAVNLDRRLKDHLQPSESNRCVKELVNRTMSAFRFAKVPAAQLDGVEKYLYDRYRPRCNEVDPGGTAITVNLP